MIDLINASTFPQAPTESTPSPPPLPVPYTVQDRVTLSSIGNNDHGGIDAAPSES